MTFENGSIQQFIQEKNVDAGIAQYGIDDVVHAFGGVKHFIELFGQDVLTKYIVDFEHFQAMWKRDDAGEFEHDTELIGTKDINEVIKNNSIDQLIKDYNKNRLTKKQLLDRLTVLERTIDGANWSFGFSLDGTRLLVRTFTQKIVFNLGENNEHASIAAPPIQEIPRPERPKFRSTKIPIIFSGSARTPIDEPRALELIVEILKKYPPDEYIVVTGGYPEGIPHLAALAANRLGMETAAIVPEIVNQTKYGGIDKRLYKEENIFTVGEDWGDETEALIGTVGEKGVVYFLGGGFWTEIEYRAAKNMGVDMRFVEGLGGMSKAISYWRSGDRGELILDEVVTTSAGEYRITKNREKKQTPQAL
jgi:hypothetical protein